MSYNSYGYDKFGYNRDACYVIKGYDYYGFNKEGIHKTTNTKFNTSGLDRDGFDKFGFNQKDYIKSQKRLLMN